MASSAVLALKASPHSPTARRGAYSATQTPPGSLERPPPRRRGAQTLRAAQPGSARSSAGARPAAGAPRLAGRGPTSARRRAEEQAVPRSYRQQDQSWRGAAPYTPEELVARYSAGAVAWEETLRQRRAVAEPLSC